MQELELVLWPHHGLISILRACPIFFFAYSCQVNVAQIFDELPGQRGGGDEQHVVVDGTMRVGFMRKVAWVAIGLCTILYGSISLVTLMDFGDALLPNVLSCYRLSGKESALLHLAFLAMAVAVIMAFPLNVFPARLSIIQMWEAASAKPTERLTVFADGEEDREPLLLHDSKKHSAAGYGSDEEASGPHSGRDEDPLQSVGDHTPGLPVAMDVGDTEPFPLRQHRLVTLLVAGSALGLALVVPNISVVFGLLGGTTSSLLGFVVPGLLGLSMEDGSCSKASAWVLVVAGTVIGIVTTAVTLYSTVCDTMHC
jgi:amino acid permease